MSNASALDTALAQIRALYEECPFLQLKLLSEREFVSYLSDRDLHFLEEHLHEFEHILLPVGGSDESRGQAYHPYQVWIAHKLAQANSPNLNWSYWKTATPDVLKRFVATHERYVADALRSLTEMAPQFYSLLSLMVAADPYTIPMIRGKVSLPFLEPGRSGHAEYLAWRRSFDSKSIVSTSRLTLDQIKRWHEALSTGAGIANDARDWYLLMRHATFDKRNRLRGGLRLAFDFYEMAESLRILLKHAGEKVLQRMITLALADTGRHGSTMWRRSTSRDAWS